jgi:uncharacterized membrane protein YraQ (UPF0718 family)
MIDFLLGVLQATWAILEDASVYLLAGFLLAGVLAVLVVCARKGRRRGRRSPFWSQPRKPGPTASA